MTPLHPFAAVAAGAMMGLAALTAPFTVTQPGAADWPPCPEACVTAAATASPEVGDVVTMARLHIITHPGRYGLSDPPKGEHFAVLDGRLVRIHAETLKVRSVLRPITVILD
ncbi:hypothetical protein E4L95_19125 [Paracoccus liaowanqingii]|uniref:Uncharacterized protein n=1 Tax=Paracoccus liaowanqingii TaxID=2560053 RepID=A0A4Z1CDX5_9RHOB|nr:hypothetical protein [Paracoccus liaowanqingii]TGN47728.1 hypothetical protein E4L95_19125 [Paracoccus liaowanqingii]